MSSKAIASEIASGNKSLFTNKLHFTIVSLILVLVYKCVTSNDTRLYPGLIVIVLTLSTKSMLFV